MPQATITVNNGRVIGTTGDYAPYIGTISFNSPVSDCGVDFRCDVSGVPMFVVVRIGSRDFATTVPDVEVENTLILSHINGVASGTTLQQLFDNLSAALSQ